MTFDTKGNLYGATQYGGGFGSCNAPYYQYCGTVFKLSPPKTKGGKWTEKVLHSFNHTDGWYADTGLIFDGAGNLYGTTAEGGAGGGGYGAGTVFEITP